MPVFSRIACFALMMTGATAAGAQSTMSTAGMKNGRGDDGTVRVQSNLSISMPANDDADAAAQQEAATHVFYKLVAGSCALVTDTIGDTCSITNVTSNVALRNRAIAGQAAKISVTGQITMKVKLRDSVGKGP